LTSRIHLDDLTSADLGDLYARVEAAEAAVEAAERLASRWAVLRAYGGAATELRAALSTAPRPPEPGATGRRIRTALPVLRAALDSLPQACRYHDDRLDPGDGPAWGSREACCDTGIPARRRREAETALHNLDRLARQPARVDVDRAALLPPVTEAISTWRFVGDAAAAEAVLDVLAGSTKE
jgi:hypothetical protein